MVIWGLLRCLISVPGAELVGCARVRASLPKDRGCSCCYSLSCCCCFPAAVPALSCRRAGARGAPAVFLPGDKSCAARAERVPGEEAALTAAPVRSGGEEAARGIKQQQAP